MNKMWVDLNALVIEDDRAYAQLVTSLLESAGLKTTIASTGSDGVELYRRGKFDVVVVDLHLPDMTGCDVIQILRAHTAHNATVVALTGTEDKEQMERAIQAGADDLYSKQIGPHVLRAKFSSLAHRLADEQRERLKVEEIEDRLEKNISDLMSCAADRTQEIHDLSEKVDAWIKLPPVLRPEQIEHIATVAAEKAVAKAAEVAAEKAVTILRQQFEMELGRSVLNKGAMAIGGLLLAGISWAAGKGLIQP